MTSTLSKRALNRALLDRQMLLHREDLPAAGVIERLVGMQAEDPISPYYALWARLTRFEPDELADLLTGRRAVRTWLLRGTIHLVTARDCLVLRPLVQQVLERALQGTFGRRLEGVDLHQVAAYGRELVEDEPRTRSQLIPLLRERYPNDDTEALSHVVRLLVPLVQIPPRGLWGQRGQVVLTSAEAWLGKPLAIDPSPDELVLRYLAAFGPASTADIRTWSGLAGLRNVTDRLRPQLRTFQDESGKELFDLPGASLPDPDIPAPPRFLPALDNVFLSHEDRARIIDPELRAEILTTEWSIQPVLIDGFIRAKWKVTREPAMVLTVEPFGALTKRETDEVTTEGTRLLNLSATGESHDIRFVLRNRTHKVAHPNVGPSSGGGRESNPPGT